MSAPPRTAPPGYERQRIVLAMIVLKLIALETAGSRSRGKRGSASSRVLSSVDAAAWSCSDRLHFGVQSGVTLSRSRDCPDVLAASKATDSELWDQRLREPRGELVPGDADTAVRKRGGAASNRGRVGRGFVLAAGLVSFVGAALLAFALLNVESGHIGRGTASAPMARISVHGRRLYAGSVPWRAWGMNWGLGDHSLVLAYFDNPTSARFAVLTSELHTAHLMGANSMRIFLELAQVMQSPSTARPRTLRALQTLLDAAAREHIYLDITGNLAWRPKLVPAWYDRLSEQSRWQVQANFWRAVAHAAASSPAVLCYELTSEPIVGETPDYYLGQFGGFRFVQSIGTRRGRSARDVARAWTSELAAAVRSQDNRPVTIGLLPLLHDGFAPNNVADLLDMLVVHEYPQSGKAASSVAAVKGFASLKKPVLLGETYDLCCDTSTERTFLLGANRYLVGTFEFFDGRNPNHITVKTAADAMYQQSLRQFIQLRTALLKPQ